MLVEVIVLVAIAVCWKWKVCVWRFVWSVLLYTHTIVRQIQNTYVACVSALCLCLIGVVVVCVCLYLCADVNPSLCWKKIKRYISAKTNQHWACFRSSLWFHTYLLADAENRLPFTLPQKVHSQCFGTSRRVYFLSFFSFWHNVANQRSQQQTVRWAAVPSMLFTTFLSI